MNRYINLVSIFNQDTTLPNVTNINLVDIDKIVDCSVDTIFCASLEYLQNDHIYPILTKILNKLRPQATALIKFTNYKEQCRYYIAGTITDQDFFNSLKNKQTMISLDSINNMLSSLSNYNIINMEQNNETVILTIKREAI
jgi:hypothetical protein